MFEYLAAIQYVHILQAACNDKGPPANNYALQRRWIIAKDEAIADGNFCHVVIVFQCFVDWFGWNSASKKASKALQKFTVHTIKCASANLYHFQKVLDNTVDGFPGKRYRTPSEVEFCKNFLDRVVKYLPKNKSNSLYISYISAANMQEIADVFDTRGDGEIDTRYEDQTHSTHMTATLYAYGCNTGKGLHMTRTHINVILYPYDRDNVSIRL